MAEQIKCWVPTKFVDEVTPAARIAPEAWLKLDDETGIYISDDSQDCDPSIQDRMSIAVGTVVMFDWVINYPPAVITVHHDGTWQAHSAVASAATNFCVQGDPDTMGYSLDEFVRNMATTIDLDEPETLDVEMYQWSSEPAHLRLALVDGRLTFVPAEIFAAENGGAA